MLGLTLLMIVKQVFSLDPSTPSGAQIPIEERPPSELCQIGATTIAPQDAPVWNPAFDITPAHLIAAWVTEDGFWAPQGRPTLDANHEAAQKFVARYRSY